MVLQHLPVPINSNLYKQGYDLGYSNGYSDGLSKTTSSTQNANIQYIYHEHTSACYGPCGATIYFEMRYGVDHVEMPYTACRNGHGAKEGTQGQSCKVNVLKCGKTTSTIESAVIVFE